MKRGQYAILHRDRSHNPDAQASWNLCVLYPAGNFAGREVVASNKRIADKTVKYLTKQYGDRFEYRLVEVK